MLKISANKFTIISTCHPLAFCPNTRISPWLTATFTTFFMFLHCQKLLNNFNSQVFILVHQVLHHSLKLSSTYIMPVTHQPRFYQLFNYILTASSDYPQVIEALFKCKTIKYAIVIEVVNRVKRFVNSNWITYLLPIIPRHFLTVMNNRGSLCFSCLLSYRQKSSHLDWSYFTWRSIAMVR